MITMPTKVEKGAAFHALHTRHRAFIIPNPWDVGSARLLTDLGFEALATTSAGYAFSVGRPDNSIGRDETLGHAAAIVACTHLPIAADLENCFGDSPEIVAETIRLAAQTGLVGGSIEDVSGRVDCTLYELGHAVDRVRAAAEVVRSLPFRFTLTARAENYLVSKPDLRDTLFFFDFVYPGIGPRMGGPDRLTEIWYQSFNQMEMAPTLVGASQETCRAYICHFLRHWAYRKNAFDDVLSAFIENFMKPGNLVGGFAHYKASHAGRIAMIKGQAPTLPPITVPTCVRWPEHDPLCPYEWTDRLGETFIKLDLAPFPDVGHFPHREDPDCAAAEISTFFDRLGWR